jgi:hypothetical protein
MTTLGVGAWTKTSAGSGGFLYERTGDTDSVNGPSSNQITRSKPLEVGEVRAALSVVLAGRVQAPAQASDLVQEPARAQGQVWAAPTHRADRREAQAAAVLARSDLGRTMRDRSRCAVAVGVIMTKFASSRQ